MVRNKLMDKNHNSQDKIRTNVNNRCVCYFKEAVNQMKV